MPGASEGDYPYYLLGGDTLPVTCSARVIAGSTKVILIAPLATLFAFMVGITLGLPRDISAGAWIWFCHFWQTLFWAFL